MTKHRRKTFIGQCSECATEQKLTFVGESEELGIIWLHCPGCSSNHHYDISTIRKGRVLTSTEIDNLGKMSDIVEYSPRKTFIIGQLIHHALLDDQGKVIEKKTTIDDHHLIRVRFQHIGTKYLVEASGVF